MGTEHDALAAAEEAVAPLRATLRTMDPARRMVMLKVIAESLPEERVAREIVDQVVHWFRHKYGECPECQGGV